MRLTCDCLSFFFYACMKCISYSCLRYLWQSNISSNGKEHFCTVFLSSIFVLFCNNICSNHFYIPKRNSVVKTYVVLQGIVRGRMGNLFEVQSKLFIEQAQFFQMGSETYFCMQIIYTKVKNYNFKIQTGRG